MFCNLTMHHWANVDAPISLTINSSGLTAYKTTAFVTQDKLHQGSMLNFKEKTLCL